MKKVLSLVLALALSLGMFAVALADVDYANLKDFKIENVPQEKLDTTLYLAVSVRGLENPYIATIKVGMEMFAQYLDSIGQKYEMQVLDSQGDNDKEVDNMRQFSAKAGGNAIAYSDPNENSIAYPLAEAMAESGGYIGTAGTSRRRGPEGPDPQLGHPHLARQRPGRLQHRQGAV
jgi:ribose transport system substrate-binding protein